MLKTSTSAKNLLLSVIPWQNVQTMRDHILVNVNLDTLELALSIVQVNITIMFPNTAPITDISIFNNYVARNRKIGRFIVIFSNLFILPQACASATKTSVESFWNFVTNFKWFR